MPKVQIREIQKTLRSKEREWGELTKTLVGFDYLCYYVVFHILPNILFSHQFHLRKQAVKENEWSK